MPSRRSRLRARFGRMTPPRNGSRACSHGYSRCRRRRPPATKSWAARASASCGNVGPQAVFTEGGETMEGAVWMRSVAMKAVEDPERKDVHGADARHAQCLLQRERRARCGILGVSRTGERAERIGMNGLRGRGNNSPDDPRRSPSDSLCLHQESGGSIRKPAGLRLHAAIWLPLMPRLRIVAQGPLQAIPLGSQGHRLLGEHHVSPSTSAGRLP